MKNSLKEETLQKTQARFNQLLASITSIMIWVDQKRHVIHWNSVTENTFGLPASQCLNRLLMECKVDWDIDRILEGIKRCQKENSPTRIDDIYFVRANGEKGFLGMTVIPIRGDAQEEQEFLLFGADITERKKTEEELRIANKRMKEISFLKDNFVANVSHELRSPLTAIKEGISLIADGSLGKVNDEQCDFLKNIDENIDRLTELINNLLDLSKIESGRIQLQRRRCRIEELIDATFNSYRTIIGKRTVKKEISDSAEVFVCPNRMIQVLGNLVSNAVKFTKETGIINFLVRRQNKYLSVSIEDDGIGISNEDIKKLFQKFSQVGQLEDKPKGTGLGLALCKEIVNLHKGSISVTSELGKGSRFTFTLPLYTSEFALEESFQELIYFAERSQQGKVGMIVFDGSPFLRGRQVGKPILDSLEEIAEEIHKKVQSSDIVLALEPHWIVVMAIADAGVTQKMVDRLRKAMEDYKQREEEAPVSFGVALYPTDGTKVNVLFEKATQQSIQEQRGETSPWLKNDGSY